MADEKTGGAQAAQPQLATEQKPQETPAEPQSFSQVLLAVAARLFSWVLIVGQYMYLLRVPILIAGIFIAFPFAALLSGSPLKALFQNLFLMGPLATFWSTMAALILAWGLLLTGRIVLLNCEDRFGIPAFMSAATLSGWVVFGILGLALPTILGQFTQQADFGTAYLTMRIVAVVAAALCSYLMAFAALWFAVLLAPPDTQGSALTFPCISLMRRWLNWADTHHILPSRIHPGVWVRKHLPPSLWQGYLASDGFLWSGHWLALLFGIATLLLCEFIDWWHGRAVGAASGVTALTFVLLLLLNANWVLAFLAFFLDRFRVPLVIPLALFALISGNARSSDHFFHIRSASTKIAPISAADVLRARAGKPIVLVATAGGGIQAAAWTAQVFTGLDDLYKKWKISGNFEETVTLISSVSGGATGSMFYLNLYDPAEPNHFRSNDLPGLVDLVSKPSLDDIAWALVYHDLPRIFFPSNDHFSDRGNVLEQDWSKRAALNSTLSEWRTGVKEGWRPVTIFNSTITESGEPLVFSTANWISETGVTAAAVSPQRENFYEMYNAQDLDVVTAVRLAATFPYVTPAARPDTGGPKDFHMIDGGYYDNYGISSLISWLELGLSDLQRECEAKASKAQAKKAPDCRKQVVPPILILQIRSFPPDQKAQAAKKGWAFQLYAPIKGLLAVRSTAQLVNDREELSMFARRWEPDAAETPNAKIQFATLEYGGFNEKEKDKAKSPPLSWAMNPAQIEAVKSDWKSRLQNNDPDIDKIHCFFDAAFTHCEGLSHKPK